MYKGLFGLSCVENHVLAILRQRKERIEYAYYDCAVPLRDLYKYMFTDGVKQEYFHLTERIQDVLKGFGIIELEKKKTGQNFPEELKKHMFRSGENGYFLIKVTPEFTKKQLSARGFREDHFVYARIKGEGLEVFNDIPERVLMISWEQLREGYGGAYFYLFIKRRLCEEDINFLWRMRRFRPEEETDSFLRRNVDSDIENTGIRLRNLIGVYKQLRYRMKEYYGNYVDTGFIQEAMPKVEKLYAMSDYYNLKNETAMDKYTALFYRLCEIDDALMTRLKKKLEW